MYCSVIQPGAPLYEYVHTDDGMYSYYELSTYVQNGFTTYVINMTSQQWLDGEIMTGESTIRIMRG